MNNLTEFKDLIDKELTKVKKYYVQRLYHNLDHITGMLSILDKLELNIDNNQLEDLIYAIIWHDSVINYTESDELSSAQLFTLNSGVDKNKEVSIYNLILSTKNFYSISKTDRESSPCKILHDLDYWYFRDLKSMTYSTSLILKEYIQYCKINHQEYNFQCLIDRRINFLKLMLERRTFFYIKYSELTIKENIKKHINDLQVIKNFIDNFSFVSESSIERTTGRIQIEFTSEINLIYSNFIEEVCTQVKRKHYDKVLLNSSDFKELKREVNTQLEDRLINDLLERMLYEVIISDKHVLDFVNE